MTISQAIEKLGRLDLAQALEKVLGQTEEQYEDLNRSQLLQGKLNDGSDLTPPYSVMWSEVRERHGLQIDHVDLKFTGNFYKGFTMKMEGETLQLGSDVEYEGSLSARYSEKIYGLSEENADTYRELIRPLVIAEVKAQYNNG